MLDGAVTVLGVRQMPDGGYVVVDGEQREHHAADAGSLGVLVARLCNDPAIRREPVVDEIDPNVSLVANMARKLRPESRRLVDVLEPLAHVVTAHARKMPISNGKARKRRSGRSATR